MQKLGRKSIVTEFQVPCEALEKRVTVLVQANKNYGICDIILVTSPEDKVRLADVLSVFQGRQINDSNVAEHLWNVLNETINPEEK